MLEPNATTLWGLSQTNIPQSVVAFAGDWHGDSGWAEACVQSLAAAQVRVLFHVGDFGIWPGPAGKKYLTRVEKVCAASNMTILVTPGNHEDWGRLDQKRVRDIGDGWGPVQHLSDHIKVLPRAHRFTMTTPTGTTRSFVSLGGAPSLDFERRVEGRSWFPTEAITEEDVERTIAGGFADIMIAHDSPDAPYAVRKVVDILASNPFGFSDRALDYASVGRERMTRAYEGVAPSVFFHGHYHASDSRVFADESGDQRQVVGLNKQYQAGNMFRLDLDTLGMA
jgi:hypothetical protein